MAAKQFGFAIVFLVCVLGIIKVVISGINGDPGQLPDKKKVCYFTNWAIYRTGNAKFTTDDIDFENCNIILYAFASLDEQNYVLKLSDPFADLPDGNGYDQINKVVKKAEANGAIPVVSIGGWNDSNKTAYGTLYTDEKLQEKFVSDSVNFLKKYGFKGLDWDHEYPQCPQGKCNPGTAEKDGFSKLVKKIRTEYTKHGFYLSAAVSGSVDKLDTYYDAPVLNENLDWIGLMTYDYVTAADSKVIGLTAPFFQYGKQNPKENVKATVDAWLSRNVASTKLVLGVPFYGVSFTLADKSKFTIGSPANGFGFKNRSLFYNEICELTISQNWTKVSSEDGHPIGGTYAYHEDQWVGYDDVEDVQAKGKYIIDKNLGGFMIWSLDEDDFKDVCKQGKYPLLSALSKSVDGKSY